MFIEPIIIFLATVMPYNHSQPKQKEGKHKMQKEVIASETQANSTRRCSGGWDGN